MLTKSKLARVLVLSALTTFALASYASSDKGPLHVHVDSYAITQDASGQEVATKTKQVDRNQTVELRAIYENTSADPLNDIAVMGPIPAGTEYLEDSAKAPVAANFQVSIDGGQTFESEPVKRQVKDRKGHLVETIIPASQYTHVRWQPEGELAANDVQTYTYRVKVK